MKRIYKLLTGFFAVSIIAGVLLSCKPKDNPPDPEFISAVSSGFLGRNDSVIVRFNQEQNTERKLPSNAISLRPSVRGEVSWQNPFTLVFTPSESYRPGTEYQVTVNVPDVPSFNFVFMTTVPTFNVQVQPIQINANDEVIVSGIVTLDNDADISRIEDTITSKDLGKPSWSTENGLYHFVFNPIARKESSVIAEFTWDASLVGGKSKGTETVVIPGEENFEMLSLRFTEGAIEVSFSSPIKPNQDLRGFISLSGNTQVRYTVNSNIIRIFGDGAGGIPAGTELVIQDLEDANGKRLNTPVRYTVPEAWEIPEIRFGSNGVILPTSQGGQLVIETKNLSGVIVEAFHIYGDNMLQFLQINNLSGDNQLDRVGEPVWSRAYDFQWNAGDQNRWVRRGLDMSELSRRFPGGMFHIRVSFRSRHVEYICSNTHGDFSHLEFPNDDFPSIGPSRRSNFWNSYSSQPGYNWREWDTYRNDPCHPSFYIRYWNSERNVNIARNVLVSDLGIFTKRTNDGSWLIVTTNILTGRAAGNTDYIIYNYQGRILHQGKTGSDGSAIISASANPERIAEMGDGSRLVVFAQSNLGRAYLRVNDSNVLGVSHFDIAGGSPSTGLRGLIYGERDVWRPGDEVFLTFLLADPSNTLPRNHPISFEVEDPRGRVVVNRTQTNSTDGFYPIHFTTNQNAPTGDWLARVRVGGVVFSRAVKIETIMPNRLKIDLDFGEGREQRIIKSNQRNVSIEAAWLYGSPAPGLKADLSVSFADKETTFSEYAEYTFRDQSRTVSGQRQTVWEGTLDGNGKANFQMRLNPGTAVPGKVTARFMTRAFEPSGVFSSEQISMEYSPYSRYVGLKVPPSDAARNRLVTGRDHKAEIVILNEEGQLVTGNINLDCAIYKVNWRWWWEKSTNEAAEFASMLSRTPAARGTVTARNGKAEWSFRINEPDWGRYIVIARDREGGHAASQIVFIDWPHWASRGTGGMESTSALVLTPSKTTYNVTEKVQVSFPSNREAMAYVVLEKGGQVIKSEWIQCQADTTRYEFTAEPSMLPNLYMHVTLLQPHMQTQNDLPIRLYGIVPIMIEDPNIELKPVIRTAETWQAESQVSFSVREASGRPMTYTVAVVDEGLLGLTRFNLPNPKNTFYAKEASFLKSWDLFMYIMGAHSGRLETLLAIGGGDDIQIDPVKETQRFKPVVRFFGPFELGRGQEKTESFELPPYIGAVRIMVLAASSGNENRPRGSQRAYGTAETSVTVTSDLMVFATLPRILSPNDEVVVPVYVNSLRGGNRNVRVTLTVPGAQIIGDAVQNVSFTRSEEQLIRFRVKAPANPAALQFTTTAESSGLKTAQHQIDMEVRSTAIPITRSQYRLIQPNDSWNSNLEYPGREGTNTLAMGFSRLPPINLESRLNWLVRYPHGCLEQTTSGAFPQLYLDKVMQMSESQKAELRTNVNIGITRVIGMQLMNGGFSYWSGEIGANDWASSYAGHFLLEARKQGYAVPQNVIRAWVQYQRNIASNWQVTSGRFVEQAYRLYTLALAGEADIGSMNRLRSVQNLPSQVNWRLAAAYWLAGQRDTARAMTQRLSIPQNNYRELSGTFGSTFRDKAMILETLVLLDAGHERIFPLYEEMSKELSSDKWLSTQETAYALIAMIPYMITNAQTGNITMDYNIANLTGSVNFSTAAAEQNLGSVRGVRTPFNITNKTNVPVYAMLTATGIPEEGREPALAEGLVLNVEYRVNNRVVDPNTLKLGDDMEVIVKLRNSYTQVVEEVALIVPVPASWEIINTRLAGGGDSNFRYQDIRDDRVMTYFNLNRGEERVVRFMVNKTYDGVFFRPAIHAYTMYDESIRALIPGVRQ